MIRSISTLPDYTNRLRLMFFLLIFTWVILGSIFIVDRINLSSMASQNADHSLQLSSLKLKQEALENKLAELTKSAPNTAQNNIAPEAALEPSAQNNVPADIKSGLAEVNDRTATLEKKLDAVNESIKKADAAEFSSNLMLTAIHLRDAVRESKSFSNEVESLKISAQDDPQIAENLKILEKDADKGIAPLSEIKLEFDQVANAILLESKRNKENKTFVDKAALPLFSMVKVQKIEAATATNQTDDILARAYKLLLKDDLDGALAEVKKMQEEPKKLASNWIEKAESNVAARAAAEKIFASAARRSYANNVQPNGPAL